LDENEFLGKKLRTNGSIEKFNARPFVICYQEVENVDFLNTYSHI